MIFAADAESQVMARFGGARTGGQLGHGILTGVG
jgi:hypothetical protein